jgi:hypothetical protein
MLERVNMFKHNKKLNLIHIQVIFIINLVKSIMDKSRRIFNYENLTETKIVSSLDAKQELYPKSISAGGCLFYKKVAGQIKLLLTSYPDPKWNKLDDLGGRSDHNDNTIFETIIRETMEESNNMIDVRFLLEKIKSNDYRSFYNLKSKYYIMLVEVDDDFSKDTSIFGTFEKTDKIVRYINWYDYDTAKPKLALRLSICNDLINYLDSK